MSSVLHIRLVKSGKVKKTVLGNIKFLPRVGEELSVMQYDEDGIIRHALIKTPVISSIKKTEEGLTIKAGKSTYYLTCLIPLPKKRATKIY